MHRPGCIACGRTLQAPRTCTRWRRASLQRRSPTQSWGAAPCAHFSRSTHTVTRARAHARTHARTHAHKHARTHTHTHAHAHTHTHPRIHPRTHAPTPTPTHPPTHPPTQHAHTCASTGMRINGEDGSWHTADSVTDGSHACIPPARHSGACAHVFGSGSRRLRLPCTLAVTGQSRAREGGMGGGFEAI